MNMVIVTIGSLKETVCFKCKEPLEDDPFSWRNLQAIYESRRSHIYCHDCYKRWLPECER